MDSPLRVLAAELGIAAKVRYLGYHNDIRALLEALDVYAQPSVMEALGLAVLEAAAMGLPVVASDIGGLPEVVQHEQTGLLVPPADPGALSQALVELLSNAERRETYGRAGATMAHSGFSRARMAAETSAVYAQLLASYEPKRVSHAGPVL